MSGAWGTGAPSSKPSKYGPAQKQLQDMGFGARESASALEKSKGNLSVATTILLGDTTQTGSVGGGVSGLGGGASDMQGMISVGTSGNDKAAARASAREEAIKERHQRFMSFFKVHKCKEKMDRNHDKRMCFNWHTKADRRRNPFEVQYSCSECPQYADTDACDDGDNCLKAHNMLERMFHPDLFKISMCQKPHSCERGDMCAFAHSEEDQRVAPPKTAGLAYNAASQTSLGAYLPNTSNAASSSSASTNTAAAAMTREKAGSKAVRGASNASTAPSSMQGNESINTGTRNVAAATAATSSIAGIGSNSKAESSDQSSYNGMSDPGLSLLDGVVRDTQQRLVALITDQGSSGIISSELPKRYKEAYGENLVLQDENKVSFRIKDLLLSQPGISMTMHKGVQPKYVYNQSAKTQPLQKQKQKQQQQQQGQFEALPPSVGVSPRQTADNGNGGDTAMNAGMNLNMNGGISAFPYLDGDIDVDAMASAILRGEAPGLHQPPVELPNEIGDVNDDGSIASLTGVAEGWGGMAAPPVIASTSTRQRGPSSSSPLTLGGGLGPLDAPPPHPQAFSPSDVHPPVDTHDPFSFGIPGGGADASAFGANVGGSRRRRGPDLPGSSQVDNNAAMNVNEMPGMPTQHLGDLSMLGGGLGVGPTAGVSGGLDDFGDFSNPHAGAMNSSIFGLDMAGGMPTNMNDPGRDAAREEQLARENTVANNTIAEQNAKLAEYERSLAAVSLEKEKILMEWKKTIGHAAGMQKVMIAKDADIAKFETIGTETRKLLQQSEEHQKVRLVPELKTLQALLGTANHDLESARVALDAKNIAYEKLGAEHDLAIVKLKQENLKAKDDTHKQLAELREKNRRLQEEKEDLALENADLAREVYTLPGNITKSEAAVSEVKNCSLPGCSEPGVFRCMKCKKVSYCGQEHQKKHWPVHKKTCSE